MDGSFSFSADPSPGAVVLVSYIGYEDLEMPYSGVVAGTISGDLGMVKMTSLNVTLDEVRVTADYGIDRQTPTTFSAISTKYVEE